MAALPVVSVVVPVRDGARDMGGCLDALPAQRGAPPYEVLVVDNGSTDSTAATVLAHPSAPTLLTESRPGSYAARNAGITVAVGSILAFTDADCTPTPTWLAEAVAALDSAELAAGRIAMHRSARPTVVERYDRAVYLRQEDLVRDHGWAVTANLVLRRSVVDDIGPFDPALPSGGDREFCLRARAAGHRLVYAPDAVLGHPPRTRIRELWTVNLRIGSGFRRRARVARHHRRRDSLRPQPPAGGGPGGPGGRPA